MEPSYVSPRGKTPKFRVPEMSPVDSVVICITKTRSLASGPALVAFSLANRTLRQSLASSFNSSEVAPSVVKNEAMRRHQPMRDSGSRSQLCSRNSSRGQANGDVRVVCEFRHGAVQWRSKEATPRGSGSGCTPHGHVNGQGVFVVAAHFTQTIRGVGQFEVKAVAGVVGQGQGRRSLHHQGVVSGCTQSQYSHDSSSKVAVGTKLQANPSVHPNTSSSSQMPLLLSSDWILPHTPMASARFHRNRTQLEFPARRTPHSSKNRQLPSSSTAFGSKLHAVGSFSLC